MNFSFCRILVALPWAFLATDSVALDKIPRQLTEIRDATTPPKASCDPSNQAQNANREPEANYRNGANFEFVRCQLSKGDPGTQMFSMEIDLKDSSVINFFENETIRNIELPWMEAYFATLKTPDERKEFLNIIYAMEQTKRFNGTHYPPEFDSHFLINGPMIDKYGKSVGLLIKDDKIIAPINGSNNDGNFSSQSLRDPAFGNEPNGVIIIYKDGTIEGLTRSEAEAKLQSPGLKSIKLAFQGGPIMSKKSDINKNFNPSSQNLNPRVTACVTNGGKLRIMSSNSVLGATFFDMATFGLADSCFMPSTQAEHKFAKEKKCKFSIYMDGADKIVDATFVPGGLASVAATGIRKNFLDIKLVK